MAKDDDKVTAAENRAKAKTVAQDDAAAAGDISAVRAVAIADLSATIPGGAYLASDGKTWTDANGELLSAEKIAEAKKQSADRDDARGQLSDAINQSAPNAALMALLAKRA